VNGIFILRFVIFGLALALAAVLIARGNVLIGGLIGALALTRIAMFFMFMHRRKEFRARMQQRREQGGGQGPGRPGRGGRWS
jgi:hypothetical protein